MGKLFVALGLFIGFSVAVNAAETTVEKSATTARKISSQISSSDLGRKYMELADMLAQGINNEQICELEISTYEITSNLIKALSYDRSLLSSIPESVKTAIGNTLGYKAYAREPGPLVKEDFYDVTVQVVAPSAFLAGTLAFARNGTFSEIRGIWNEKTEDFGSVKLNGTWVFTPAGPGKRKMPSISLNFKLPSGKTKTKVYTVIEDQLGDFYFVKGHKGKFLGYGDKPKFTESGYTSVDWMICGD